MMEKKLYFTQIRLLWLGVITYFAGCAVTLAHAHFEIRKYYELKLAAQKTGQPFEEITGGSGWDYFYYIWEAVLFVVLFKTVSNLIPKSYRWIVEPAFYYSIIRLLWELSFLLTGLDVNHPMAVNIASTIMLAGVIMLLLKDLVIRWKQK